jgi:NADH-quinone oxidoreductase subunit H
MPSIRIWREIDRIEPGDADAQCCCILRKKAGKSAGKAKFASPGDDFYLTNPIARASAVMAECSALGEGRQGRGGGIRADGSHSDFMTTYVWPVPSSGAELLLLVALLVIIAYILYADRKIWAAVQMRRGPNVVGPWGLFQSFADLLKFVLKEPVIPSGANKAVFLLAPLVTVSLALAAWAVIPVNAGWVIADINVGILFVFAISSLGVYGVIMGGWASNSKYPFLGALRSAAQMVSYEVSIGFVIVTVLLCVGSLNLSDIVLAQSTGIGTMLGCRTLVPRLALAAAVPDVRHLLHLGAGRDQPSAVRPAGSRIGAGGRLHGGILGSTPYMMFMLGEYVAIALMCALTTILFLGGWLPPFDFAPFTWVPGIVWFVLKAAWSSSCSPW